ncbi:cupin domain-containing protein [Telluribacter sp. SYSU D00476]|uniref:cupin domain-containing protein n=1 Tax=Telluribacter sp. SYSU D00476 TaxID=2811430 RepID=UPI001FF19BAD|nr:cupin domain-containing protein [Telluribacter sp. SYSU D00476]
MAYRNKKISNPKTQQDIRFLLTGKDTDGQLLEMETTYNAFSKEPAAHYHPNQDETFIVLEGEINIRMDGQLRVLRKGDRLDVPKNKVHSMWNSTPDRAVVNWKVRPALETDHLLETLHGLANDGKTNDAGMPPLLQVAMMINKYDHVMRLAKPNYAIQKAVFAILTPLAYLLGYKPTYEKYLD